MTPVVWSGAAVGAVLLVLVWSSVLKTVVVPRSTRSAVTSIVSATLFGAFRMVADRRPDYRRRDRLWSNGAPAFLITLLFVWLILLGLAFGLLLWPFNHHSLPDSMRLAGSSVFTLGIVGPSGDAPLLLVFAAAASGLIVIALQISYLPTLYSAFNRRETLVTMLEVLGGTPSWGPELLVRHSLVGATSSLPRLYERWTAWAADVYETHTTYRTLMYFRSPDPIRSWILAVLSVMDAAALQLSLCPRTTPVEARLMLRVGFVALRNLAINTGAHIASDPHPDDPITLTRSEFDDAVQRLEAAGWPLERSADEAWPHFNGWRINYEASAYYLAYHLDAPPGLWSGPRRHPDDLALVPSRPSHWEPSRRPSPTTD